MVDVDCLDFALPVEATDKAAEVADRQTDEAQHGRLSLGEQHFGDYGGR